LHHQYVRRPAIRIPHGTDSTDGVESITRPSSVGRVTKTKDALLSRLRCVHQLANGQFRSC